MSRYLYLLKEIQYNADDLRSNHQGVSAVIVKDKKILMLDHVKFNFWTIPVGKVDKGQTVEEGLVMELQEELNIKPVKFKLIGRFKKTYLRNGKRVTVDAFIFHIEKWTGTLRNNEPKKHRRIKWMTIEEIKRTKKLSDATKEMMKVFNI